MATNECGVEVPFEVAHLAQEFGCLGGVKYVYREGEYRDSFPIASIGCRQPTRFRSDSFQGYKVALVNGWVAFRSPSASPVAAPQAELSSIAPAVLTEDAELDDTLDEILRLTAPTAYFPEKDPWVSKARSLVEQAIDHLLQEFLEVPYLHRVEHSIHARLITLLTSSTELSERYPLGGTGAVTQLVHKEWPETTARAGNRRGNFDLAILSPSLVQGCISLDVFRQGRLPAPFVIEIGLDYDARHLAGDAAKLMNSRPKYGYLMHLVRETPRDRRVEQIIEHLEERAGIQTAYASVSRAETVLKLVNEKVIRTA